MYRITGIDAEEIADSRGRPTVRVSVACGDVSGSFAVPSGASVGTHEAHELRDADGHMRSAIQMIEERIQPALVGFDVRDQRTIDERLRELDGTEQKALLGGNTMVGTSIAAAKAAAAAQGIEVIRKASPYGRLSGLA